MRISNPKRIFGHLLLLTMFAAYMSCIFGFSHVHIVDGVRIVHSHPFSDQKEHTHSTSELVLFSQLADISISSLPPSEYNFKAIYSELGTIECIPVQAFVPVKTTTHFLRGPPATT